MIDIRLEIRKDMYNKTGKDAFILGIILEYSISKHFVYKDKKI